MKNILKKVFFIGIGGSGMLPLARMALLHGWDVSGSDHKISKQLKEELASIGMCIYTNHDPQNIYEHNIVVYSTAILDKHPEKTEAVKLSQSEGVQLLHRMDFLNLLVKSQSTRVAIAGTHGKTSTSSMAGWNLIETGFDPSIIVGGHPLYLKNGVRKGEAGNSVFETDESDGSFLKTNAQYRLVLNIDHDHLDYYGNFETLVKAFCKFIKEGDLVVINADDPQLLELLNDSSFDTNHIHWYSTNPAILSSLPKSMHSKGVVAAFLPNSDVMEIKKISNQIVSYRLQSALPGRHYASNALGLFYLQLLVWPRIDVPKLLNSFSTFPGVERRMQNMGEKNGVVIYDDYGHHPTEIKAVLLALRLRLKDKSKLHVVFEPHRFTRTKTLYKDFATRLVIADHIYILPIYSAGEPSIEGVTGELIVKQIQKNEETQSLTVTFQKDFDFTDIFLKTQAGDIIVFLGAGSISSKLREFLSL